MNDQRADVACTRGALAHRPGAVSGARVLARRDLDLGLGLGRRAAVGAGGRGVAATAHCNTVSDIINLVDIYLL